jgi:hypothetical protein
MDARVPAIAFFVAAGSSSLSGCAAAGASIPRVYRGPVAIVSTTDPPAGSELGAVEVAAANGGANIEQLVPLFAERVAQLGGNVGVIDDVEARFETMRNYFGRPSVCGVRGSGCGRPAPVDHEVMIVIVRGRALFVPSTRERRL